MGTEAETLIQTILRSYTGVFTDYAYISEDTLAIRTGLTRQQIYNILVTLTKRRIVDYIPHKKTPYIIYTRERLELLTCTFRLLSTKSAKPGTKHVSKPWKNMPLPKAFAGAGCCFVISEKKMSITASNATSV